VVAIVRLVLVVILFVASLLTVTPAPSNFAWEASIAVNEWGHYLAILGLLLIIPGWTTRLGKISAAFALVATILLLSPLVRGITVGRGLPFKLRVAFGAVQPRSLPGAPPRDKPISFETLFRKPPSPEVRMTTMTYVTRDGKPLMLDLYRRDRVLPPAPLVIAIHGGSWRSGGRADLPALNSYLAARGYVVASPEYRFAPQFPHPAASEDIVTVVSFLKANSAQFGIDTTRIVMLGRSAGAQLALLYAYTAKDPAVKGVVSLYGPTDQKWGWDNPSNPRVYNSAETLRQFLNGDPSTAADAYRTSSPLNFVDANTPPTLMIHGTMDPLVSVKQSARLDSALRSVFRLELHVASVPDVRDPHLFVELPWATHGCDYVFNGPCGQISTYAIERFVAAVTGGQHDPGYKFF
jgi:acetyl esterase/lipase